MNDSVVDLRAVRRRRSKWRRGGSPVVRRLLSCRGAGRTDLSSIVPTSWSRRNCRDEAGRGANRPQSVPPFTHVGVRNGTKPGAVTFAASACCSRSVTSYRARPASSGPRPRPTQRSSRSPSRSGARQPRFERDGRPSPGLGHRRGHGFVVRGRKRSLMRQVVHLPLFVRVPLTSVLRERPAEGVRRPRHVASHILWEKAIPPR